MSSRAGSKRKMEDDEDEYSAKESPEQSNEDDNSTEESSEQSEEDADGVDEDYNSSYQESSVNSGGVSTSRNIKGTFVTVDTDLLDCTVCFLPLRPPLFQCQNGHIACPSCCHKLHNKCPTCRLSLKYSRCVALEKLVESIKVPCSNSGCNKKIPYADLCKHQEDTCIHAPCFCPIPNCSFSGSISLLSAHVGNNHENALKHLKDVRHALVSIERDSPLCVIRTDSYKETLFLLVNQSVDSVGNVLSMTCIGPQTSEYSFLYELSLYNDVVGSSLRMEAPMTMSPRKWDGSTYSTDLFLFVPPKFHEIGPIMVFIDITKKNASPAAEQSTE